MDRHHVDADHDPNPDWQKMMPILSCGTPSFTHVDKSELKKKI
jgi:hypothetical protein